MKTFTYVAAIALLTAGTAFAQSSGNDASKMQNPPAQTHSMSNPSTMPSPSSSMSRQSGSMSNQSMSGSDMDHANGTAAHQASQPSPRRHIASTGSHARRSADGRENQITAQLNRDQVNGGGMKASGTMSQQAQMGGGANCSPDRPDCGMAHQNPAIQSPVQQRTYPAAPQ